MLGGKDAFCNTTSKESPVKPTLLKVPVVSVVRSCVPTMCGESFSHRVCVCNVHLVAILFVLSSVVSACTWMSLTWKVGWNASMTAERRRWWCGVVLCYKCVRSEWQKDESCAWTLRVTRTESKARVSQAQFNFALELAGVNYFACKWPNLNRAWTLRNRIAVCQQTKNSSCRQTKNSCVGGAFTRNTAWENAQSCRLGMKSSPYKSKLTQSSAWNIFLLCKSAHRC